MGSIEEILAGYEALRPGQDLTQTGIPESAGGAGPHPAALRSCAAEPQPLT